MTNPRARSFSRCAGEGGPRRGSDEGGSDTPKPLLGDCSPRPAPSSAPVPGPPSPAPREKGVAPTAGIILAGGLARRMGGGDKPLRSVAGRPILARLVAALAPQCDSLVLNANDDPARFAAFGLPVVADDIPGHPGPLAGIVAGLDHIARERPDCLWALTVSGDTPFPPADLVARLHAERAEANAEVAMAASGGRVHPVIALWPVALRGGMRGCLVEEDERRVRAFAERHPFTIVEWPSEPRDPFLNINTPEDLAIAEEVARRRDALTPTASAIGR